MCSGCSGDFDEDDGPAEEIESLELGSERWGVQVPSVDSYEVLVSADRIELSTIRANPRIFSKMGGFEVEQRGEHSRTSTANTYRTLLPAGAGGNGNVFFRFKPFFFWQLLVAAAVAATLWLALR